MVRSPSRLAPPPRALTARPLRREQVRFVLSIYDALQSWLALAMVRGGRANAAEALEDGSPRELASPPRSPPRCAQRTADWTGA